MDQDKETDADEATRWVGDLKRAAVFHVLSEERLRAFLREAAGVRSSADGPALEVRAESFRDMDRLVTRGEPHAETLWVLLDGTVDVTAPAGATGVAAIDDAFHELPVARLSVKKDAEGEPFLPIFGELEIVTGQRRRNHIVAVTDGSLLRLRGAAVTRLLREEPVAASLQEWIGRWQSADYPKQGLVGPGIRIAAHLRNLLPPPDPGGKASLLWIDRKAAERATKLPSETIGNLLRRLEADGILRPQGGQFIVDSARLDGIYKGEETLPATRPAARKPRPKRRLHSILLLTPRLDSIFWGGILASADAAARAAGFRLLVVNTDSDEAVEAAELARATETESIAAILIGSVSRSSAALRAADVPRRVADAGLPVCFIDRFNEDIQAALGEHWGLVQADNREGSRQLTQALIDRLCFPIFFVSDLPTVSAAFERRQAFLAALQEAPPGGRSYLQRVWEDYKLLPAAYERSFLLERDRSGRGGQGVVTADEVEQIGSYIARHVAGREATPVGVYAINSMVGDALCRALREAGLPIPGTPAEAPAYHLAQFDQWTSAYAPPIITAHQDPYRLGRLAVEDVVRRIEDPTATPTREPLEAAIEITGLY